MTDNSLKIKKDETLDDLQNGYYLFQSRSSFRFGIDAVLLAHFARVKEEERVMDLGCGNGIIPVLLAANTECRSITGLEIQPKSADLARRSVKWNHLEDRICIAEGDIREAATLFGAASFDVVVSNPPYMIHRHGLQNENKAAAVARHEILCSLEDVVSNASGLLRERGRFYMVHRPFRLAEIMNVMLRHRLQPKRMCLVYPYVDREPNLVLIEANKGGNSGMRVEKPLIVYRNPGEYTEEIERIYRHHERKQDNNPQPVQ